MQLEPLFASNDPPPARELQWALYGIGDLVHQIDDVKRKISFWSERLQTLEVKLKEHRGVVSAIRRMPAEILGQIFEAHQSLRSSFDSPSRSSRRELVHIMLVCRGWRTAALSAHGLWTSILIEGIDGPGLSYEKLVVWLARAGNLPRRLVIAMQRREDCPSLCSPQFGVDSACILNRNRSLVRLLLEGPPLDHLGMKVRHRRCVENLSIAFARHPQGSGRHRTVTSLTLSIQDTESLQPSYSFLSSFPSITGITLKYGPRGITALQEPVGLLERLTFLAIPVGVFRESPSFALIALSRCFNLVELRLSIEGMGFRPSLSSRHTTYLPRLTMLRVNAAVGSRSDGVSILNYLELPALETLHVTNARGSSSTASWKDFFRRHSCIRRSYVTV